MSYRITAITKEAWNTARSAEDKREKRQALSLAKECYSMKLDLITNATVVEDAINFISQIILDVRDGRISSTIIKDILLKCHCSNYVFSPGQSVCSSTI